MRIRYPWSLQWGLGVALLLCVSAVLHLWMPWRDALRAALALPFILFVPGYAMTWIAFPGTTRGPLEARSDYGRDDAMDPVERMTFAVLLSIVGVSLLVFAIQAVVMSRYIGKPITPFILTIAVACLNILLGAMAYARRMVRR